MNVLVAGGAGYIGSHAVKRLKEAGHAPVIYDNLSRGHRAVADILKVPAVFSDLNDRTSLTEALKQHKIDCVMHFAAYAYVGESVEKPLMYYWNNVATTVSVLQCMADAGVNRLVFSSTCAIFGDPERVPITEDQRKAPVSPYGRSKLMVEQILADQIIANKSFTFAALRYFNASGCALDGTTLVLNVGYSHPIRMVPPDGIAYLVEGTTKVAVTGFDKQLVGEEAARIRRTRPPEPYKGKGIRYEGEQVRRKAGKTGKAK